ncbi:hypothetical protein [Streptomyces sp. NRRL S-350]|uniref:hypothetical protein n=1 Tax=Streptomyces sp. NRRL S-350 TaxID=1463902 RepID=UPI00131EC925|nr:hypothetical protein [Streptomyces sp. NRRL S-350]
MRRPPMDDGRHGPIRETDPVASALAGEDVPHLVCQCGVVTGDFHGHALHAHDVLKVPGPAWLPVGARLALLLAGGVALAIGLMLIAESLLDGTARKVLLGLAGPAAFGVTMGLAVLLRPYIVPNGRRPVG